jgi:hypothetical protein
LAPLLNGGFFRPLSRPSAAVYIDCAERLIEAADEGGQISHDDARALVREVLARHPNVQLDEDEGGQFRDLSQRAGQFSNKLLESHWLVSRRVSLDEHHVLVTPALRHLLRALRELAEDRPAELKDFAATLRSTCQTLLSEGALDPSRLSPEEMRQTVKELLERLGRADDQMHAVETVILQHEAAQRASGTAGETLQRFLVEFHAGEHMLCYDALQEGGLLPRLNRARTIAQEALYDPFTKQRLAEGIARHEGIDPASVEAYAAAEKWLVRLERQLASIPTKQRLIDGRMADFSRLSSARYRYQTEMRGRRPEQVKSYLDAASALHAGQSFAQLAAEPGMDLLCPTTEVFFGMDALASARRRRAPVDLSFAAMQAEHDAEAAKDEIRRRNLDVLTPQRAARFIERHLPAKAERLSTDRLRITREDELLDLLAVLAFDHGPSAAPGKTAAVRWRVISARAESGTEPERIPRDPEADRLAERFTLERLS